MSRRTRALPNFGRSPVALELRACKPWRESNSRRYERVRAVDPELPDEELDLPDPDVLGPDEWWAEWQERRHTGEHTGAHDVRLRR